jgi:hypothetical protein
MKIRGTVSSFGRIIFVVQSLPDALAAERVE